MSPRMSPPDMNPHMSRYTGLTAKQLLDHGLKIYEGKGIAGTLIYENPAFILDPRRIKNCKVGAFTYFNGHSTSSMYATEVGRYGQIGESCVIGPPEHPMDWFSTHMFTFTQREHLPRFYELPEAARLAPDGPTPTPFTLPQKTVIGHDAYVGAGAFVKRGVTIGIGAVVAARSVVTKDVPPYAIVAGTPAKLMRMRLPENQIERLLALEWWRYDLAPHKGKLDFAEVGATLEYLEEQRAMGKLRVLKPDTYCVRRSFEGFDLEKLPESLYYPRDNDVPQRPLSAETDRTPRRLHAGLG